MNSELIQQRKTWFRYFPEGSIEFVMFVRVVAILMVLALGIVNDLQRPVALMTVIVLLWADYLLIVWWLVQMAGDVDELFEENLVPLGAIRSIRRQVTGLICLPSLLALLLVSPWPRVIFGSAYIDPYGSLRSVIHFIVLPICLALYLLSVVPAYRTMQRIQMGRPLWNILMLVPLVHWFALHRMMRQMYLRIAHRQQEAGKVDGADTVVPGMLAADVLWIFCLLPWVVYALMWLFRGHQPSITLVAVFGAVLAALFAIVELASMEQLQRRFVSLIRKA